tara:strand:+ start:567 stop:1319 length:753 start_codon:yes stop_codon:yes gene_type:complete
MAIYINRNAPESGIASLLALQGTRGDTELVHMTKPEVKMLRDTGRMSMNRETGLPQFSRGKAALRQIIPSILAMALREQSQMPQNMYQGGLIGLAEGGNPDGEGLYDLIKRRQDRPNLRFVIPQDDEEYSQPSPEPFYIFQDDEEFFEDEYYQPLATGGSPAFEGQIPGQGHGMQDNVLMPIKEKGGIAAVSPDEYVVPADVMAMIGNGSADAGANQMDNFIADFRTMKYGRPEQPPQMDGRRALQSLMG